MTPETVGERLVLDLARTGGWGCVVVAARPLPQGARLVRVWAMGAFAQACREGRN